MQEHQFLPNFGIDVFALLYVFLFPLSLSVSLPSPGHIFWYRCYTQQREVQKDKGEMAPMCEADLLRYMVGGAEQTEADFSRDLGSSPAACSEGPAINTPFPGKARCACYVFGLF